MKKCIKLLATVFVVLLFTGCGNRSKEKITTCTLSSNNVSNNYELKSTYEIYSRNDEVYKVETKEVVTSNSASILDYFEEYLNNTYKVANDKYNGYDYKVTKDNNQVVSKVIIDYNAMDLNKYIEDNTAMQSYVNKNNKLTLDGMKKIYESLGAVCEK